MLRPEGSPTCPSCGSERVAWIFYGLPMSFERLQPELDAGRVILGGCDCSENDPQWRCLACGQGWGRPEHLLELSRLMQEAEPRREGPWQRLRGWLGLTFDEETVLGGLARRLACMASGAGVVLAVGSVAPPWVGLAVLTVWFLPLLCYAGLRQFGILLGIGLVGLAGFRAVNWRVAGAFAIQVLEEFVLVLTAALLGGWLL